MAPVWWLTTTRRINTTSRAGSADEVAKIMEQNSLIRISSYCNGFRQVGNIVRPVTEMSDLAGLKIRTHRRLCCLFL